MEGFFEILMRRWVAELAGMLERSDREGRRRVLVRAGFGGHQECEKAVEPVKEGERVRSSWYNWGRIPVLNEVFKVCPFSVG